MGLRIEILRLAVFPFLPLPLLSGNRTEAGSETPLQLCEHLYSFQNNYQEIPLDPYKEFPTFSP